MSTTAFASGRRAVWLAAAGIVLGGLAAYHGSFSLPFVFDDQFAIVENPTIRHLWPLGDVLWPPPGGSGVGGRPLVNLTLALNYAFGGESVTGYHAANLAIHLLGGLVLFGLLRRTLVRPVWSARVRADAVPLAAVVAVGWVVHPLQTESVTCVVQRTELLVGLCYLLTLYCLVRATEPGAARRWGAASVATCLLGMTAKEVMVTAPVVALLFDRTFLAGSFREAWRQRRLLHGGLMATWLMLAWLVWRMGGSRGEAAGFGLGVTPWSYALKQCEAVPHYLRLVFWPRPLVVDYGTGVVENLGAVWPQALGLGALAAGTILAWKRGSKLGFAGAAFFIVLAPSSSVVPLVAQTMAEHRIYLPLAVVVTALALGLHALIGRRVRWAGLALAVVLSALTVQRNETYRSALTLWRDTVAHRPDNSRAHLCLGMALMGAGQAAEAEREFESALRLNPAEPTAHNNLGQLLADRGRLEEARAHFAAALRAKPNLAEIHANLADTLRELGRLDEAVREGEAAVRLKPDLAEAHCNLGLALAARGDRPAAVRHYRDALRLKPDYPAAGNNLGIALMESGQLAEAQARIEQVLRAKPDFADAHNTRGIILAKLGRAAESEAEFAAALRLKPDYAQARENLRVMRAMKNQPEPKP